MQLALSLALTRLRNGTGSGTPVTPDTRRIIAKGGIYPDSINGVGSGYTRSENRLQVILSRQPVASICMVYVNSYLASGEVNGANDITVECGLERPTALGAALTVLATFGGQPTITIPPGGLAVSDPIPASAFGLSAFAANTTYYCRTGVTVANTTMTWCYSNIPRYIRAAGQSAVLSASASSQISATGVLTIPSGGTGNSIFTLGPVAYIGAWSSTPDISLLVDGDSIVALTNDVQDTGAIGGAFVVEGTRSVPGGSGTGNIAQAKIAKFGESASDWVNFSNTNRKQMMAWATHVVTDIGGNDISLGQTSAQLEASLTQLFTDYHTYMAYPAHVVKTPIAPKTTSTDSWATTVNQTPFNAAYATGGARDIVNTYCAANVGGGLTFPDEIADNTLCWQDATTTYAWVVNGTANYATSDGIHPSPALHQGCAATVINTAATAWTLTPPTGTQITWGDGTQMTWGDGTLTTWSG